MFFFYLKLLLRGGQFHYYNLRCLFLRKTLLYFQYSNATKYSIFNTNLGAWQMRKTAMNPMKTTARLSSTFRRRSCFSLDVQAPLAPPLALFVLPTPWS